MMIFKHLLPYIKNKTEILDNGISKEGEIINIKMKQSPHQILIKI